MASPRSLRYVVPEINVVPAGGEKKKALSETIICDVMTACINIYGPCINVILVFGVFCSQNYLQSDKFQTSSFRLHFLFLTVHFTCPVRVP